MGKNKVLVKVHPEGKYVVDIDKAIDVAQIAVGARVALKNDSYTLHLLLPTKVRAVSSDSSTLQTPVIYLLHAGGPAREPHEGGKGPRLHI